MLLDCWNSNDDLLGLSKDSSKMQASMTRLAYSMAEFQMTIHPEKSCYIVFEKKKFKDQEDRGGPSHVLDIPIKRGYPPPPPNFFFFFFGGGGGGGGGWVGGGGLGVQGDNLVDSYFAGSKNEECYCKVRM